MAIGSNEQYAAGPFKANDLIVNNQAMFSNPGMMALVAKEARKGTSGFFEIPNKERAEAPFLTAAKERVNQDLGLSPAVQGGMANFLGESETVKDAPKNWKSSPNSPATELAYITDAEKKLLLDANLHDSLGDGMPNQGPSGIISLDGGGSYAEETKTDSNQQGSSTGADQVQASQQQQQDFAEYVASLGGTSAFEKFDDAADQFEIDRVRAGEKTVEDRTTQEYRDNMGMTDETIDPFAQQERETLNRLTREEADRLDKYKNQKDPLTSEQEMDYETLLGKTIDLQNVIGRTMNEEEDSFFDTIKDQGTDTAKDIAKKFGLTLEQAKEFLKSAGKKGFAIPSIAGSAMKALLDKIKYPTKDSFKDENYQAIMYDKYFDPKTGDFKNKALEDDFKTRFEPAYQDLFEGSGGMDPNENILSMKDLFKQGYDQGVTSGSDLQRRLDPSKYYEDNPLPQTSGGLEELGKLNAQDFAGNPIFQNQIFAAREATRKNDNLNAYKGGYQGPVIEKDPVPVVEQTMPETAVIDPAVGTRDFASGQTYELPTDYRAALTRDGEYGINKDPLSIAYTGGFNQMEDMDEYLKRIGKKRKNYLDADGNPIMTNAMGGL